MGLISDSLESIAGLPQPLVLAAAAAFTFGETTIGLGLVVPGEVGLLVAASTVKALGTGIVMWAVVTLAAVCGDSVGYLVGRRFGGKLRETRLIKRMGQENWDKATALIRRRGAWAVFFARWLPVVRSLTPAAAGTAGLAYPKLLIASICGAAPWAALHVTIAAMAGEAAKQIESKLSTASYFLLGGVVLAGIVFVLVRKSKAKKAATVVTPPEEEKQLEQAH
ncbi:DedA family protein [Allokutzneria albata]|uniref:Membrane protein DedA, SNARE-associated domain n=1 Tax=Allokutzneria albata TaxID=211114 RepID=A0A1H0D1P4_ALLAB|nr:DedA family protein [Allokutzneria albata]SDN64084.1 membrane protein DedA, SNARE-associated domain [Allokutzneria albata]